MQRTVIACKPLTGGQHFQFQHRGDEFCCGIHSLGGFALAAAMADYHIAPEKYDLSEVVGRLNQLPITHGILVRASIALDEVAPVSSDMRASAQLVARDALLQAGFSETQKFVNPNTGRHITVLERIW